MVQTQGIAHLLMRIEGELAPPELMHDFVSAEVHDSLFLPDMFIVRLRDPRLKWVDESRLAPGRKVKILVTDGAESLPLIEGEITALDAEFTSAPAGGHQESTYAGPTMTVRGYDLSHRLHRDRKTRSFLEQTPSEIATTLSREAGLNAQVDSTRPVPYLIQSNQTDWEFLWQLARRIGFRVYVRENTLQFSALPEQQPLVNLDWGTTLSEFSAQLTTAGQVNEVIVRGWDPESKRTVVGRATRPRQTADIGERATGGEAARGAFDLAARRILVDRPVSNQAEADQMAQAVLNEIGAAFIQADGAGAGQPRIAAGSRVKVSGIGDRFSGEYLVTECLHRYESTGYTTRLAITGHRSASLVETLAPPVVGGTGPVVGIVTNNKDPRGMGRVKVTFPWLSDSDESDWARLVTIMAGNGRGAMFLPEVDDEVLVAFEHGDIHRPYVVGAVWNGRDAPPIDVSDAVDGSGAVIRRIIKSRSGHEILIDDGPQGGITLRADGDVTVTAEGKLVLEGKQGIQIESSPGNVDVKGTLINLN